MYKYNKTYKTLYSKYIFLYHYHAFKMLHIYILFFFANLELQFLWVFGAIN